MIDQSFHARGALRRGVGESMGARLVCLWVAAFAIASSAQDSALEEGYQDLWERGEYREALRILDRDITALEPGVPTRLTHDRARLRFTVGLVDLAIEDMEAIANRRHQPSYSLELALMYRYRGRPLFYDQWFQRAATQMQGRSWYYQRRNENIAAVGQILELGGTNPKTILSAHYGQSFEYFRDLNAIVYVSAGDLAYRNAGYDIAEGYYLQALESEPTNQDALAGLMECYAKSHDPRMTEMLDRLDAINPNHPRADGLRAEQHLELGRTEEAYALIEKQLAINPVSHRFRALKASGLFLDDDLDAMEGLIEDVLSYNPVNSELYRTLGRFASRHYRFQEGLEFQEMALASDPKDYESRAMYTLDLMRLGREQEGRVELVRAFEADPFNVQLYNLLQLMDTLETFSTIERGGFVLRLPEQEEPVMAEATLELLEEALAEMEAKYEIEVEKPVLIEMFDNHDDFMVRSVGLPGNAGHLGICFGKVVTMDAPSVRPKGSSNWRSVLWHEFVHVITLQKTKNRMPRWLSEGISVYEEGERSRAWWNRLDPSYMPLLAQEGLTRLADIDAFFTQAKSAGHLMYGYFIAGDFVRFYVDAYGHPALVATLAAIAEGADAEEALVAAAETTPAELDDAFEAHLKERFAPFENLPQVAKAVAEPGMLERLTDLLPGGNDADDEEAAAPAPPSSPFMDAMNEAAQAIEAEDWDVAEDALIRAQGLFPDYSGLDSPLQRLAQLYRQLGREDDYREVMEEVVLSSPQELNATLALVEIYRAAEDWPEVIAKADWALGIDPYNPELYRTVVDGLLKSDAGHESLDELGVLTHLDSANATEYRLQRARILTDLEEWAPAKQEALLLLEELPHYWEAQKLLLEIVETDTPDAAEPLDASSPESSEDTGS